MAFLSKNLENGHLKYTITRKKAYSLVESLKHLGTYIGYSKIMAYFPYLDVKDIFSQPRLWFGIFRTVDLQNSRI